MTRLSLKQLAQSGATNGQVPGWSTAAGMWVPTTVSGGGGGGGYATGVRQIVSSYTQAVSSTTTVLPADNTIPQNTEGAQFLAVTITPQSATSTLLVTATIGAFTVSATLTPVAALFRDSAANAFAAGVQVATSGTSAHMVLSAAVASSSTASTTFKLRMGPNAAGTLYINGYPSSPSPLQYFGGVCQTGLVVMEVGL